MASPEAARIRAELFPSRGVSIGSVEDWRERELKGSEAQVVTAGITVTAADVGGVRSEWLCASPRPSARTVLYLHGGGYVVGNCATHRALVARLAIAAQARALLPEYRLAPEHPFPAAVEDAVATYDALLELGVDPSMLTVAGDSAGAGLCAALLQSLRDARKPLPALAVLICPWLDLTLSGDSYHSRAELDPIDRLPALRCMARHYVGDGDASNPLASPLFGDPRGLPPLLIQVGDHETLLDDSCRFAAKAKAAGVDVELEVWPQMWHVWHAAAPALPEANLAISRIGEYVRERLPGGKRP